MENYYKSIMFYFLLCRYLEKVHSAMSLSLNHLFRNVKYNVIRNAKECYYIIIIIPY